MADKTLIEWTDATWNPVIGCSTDYFHRVTPIFRELRSRQRRGELWREIPDKRQRFYQPILYAFETEMRQLVTLHSEDVPQALVRYLLGRHDFYEVIKENGTTAIQSFNIDGSMKWGSKVKLPTRIIEISPKPRSETTIIATFDLGWQISFRIHNASSKVEPSLKFDIKIEGLPPSMARHLIEHHG
jgi:hypothetical protein